MRVAIAGGGIAGLTAAVALAARGIAVDLFERGSAFEETGAGIQLSPNAMAVLARLGLIAALEPEIVEPQAIDIHGASGALRTSIPLGATARARYGAPYAVIHRADLQAALVAAAQIHARVAIHMRAEVGGVQGDETHVTFQAGGKSVGADVLVAADGINSRLRTGFFGHPGPRPLHKIAWRTTLPSRDAPPGISLDTTGLWLGRGAHLVHYPVRSGASLNVVVIGAADSGAPPSACFGGAARTLIESLSEWAAWPLFDVDAELSWVKGRAVLIGDAAHAMPPTAAQGGAQAIEDFWVLAACLARHADASSALRAFEQARRARVARVARVARRNMTIYALRHYPAAVRDRIIGILPAHFHLARLDWIYGWKPPEKP